MLRSVIIGVSRAVFSIGLCAMGLVVSVGETSYAANTQVNTTLCSGFSSNALLVIDTPINDSVIDELPIVITGTISEITQIDISIDGQYNSTVPVSANQTSFVTSLQLTEGTRTITFVGNDICQFQNPTESLVLTYHPKSPPIGETPAPVTSTPDDNTIDSNKITATDDNALENVPIIGDLVPILQGISRALDFDVTARKDGILTAMARFSFFVAGINMVIFGGVAVRFLLRKALNHQAIQGYIQGKNLSDPQLGAHTRRNIIIARVVGTIFLGLSFWI